MSLERGTKLGRFEIAEPLGKGGMGEVYRARDPGLNRDVAIKVLPDSLAQDPERVRRFEREARLLASLNHPNVGAVYEFERSNEILILALELVPGDTLTERMDREPGAMSIRTALMLFRQVASALEAAHARGIIHRDLKPDNIKITPEDVVKVLDFGLAKELAEEQPVKGTVSKTQTAPIRMTKEGDVLGTPAYMSPEQWRGQSLDKRSDIWSFGVCLFEALAGRHPFYARTISDVMVAVVSTEPDFGTLPSGVPRNIARLLRRCLQKDVHRRLHDIADARLEIEEALEHRFEEEVPGGGTSYRTAGLAAAGALLTGFALGWLFFVRPPAPDPIRRFTIEIPPTEPVALGGGPALAVSSDGSRLVYTVRRGDTTELRLRPMDSLEPTRLPRTEGARGPFFSSDTDRLGFFADEKLWRSSLSNLSAEPMAPAVSPRGASWWGTRLVAAPVTMGGLVAFTVTDATLHAVTDPLASEDERSHRWPSMLPGGTRALFTNWLGRGFGIEAVDLESGKRSHLVDNGSYARFAPTGGPRSSRGHLVFLRDGALWAAPFDAEALELEGEPVEILDGVLEDPLTGAGFFDLSEEGTLVYVPRSDVADEGSGQLLRIDRRGEARLIFPAARAYQVPELSPDERQILVTITEEDGATSVWRYDQDRGVVSRETTRGNSGTAVWHPDGRFTFSSDRDGNLDLYMTAADGSDDDTLRLTDSPWPKFPTDWSPDGRLLAYTQMSEDGGFDIYLWNAELGRSEPFLASPSANESAPVFSPDGDFVAYVSNETEREQVYVRTLDGSGKWTISSDGGREPVWGGTELFYRNGSVMMAVDIVRDPDFRPGKPRALFEAPYDEGAAPYANYSVSRDGSEFIMVRSNQENAATRLMVVLGFFQELLNRASGR